jgi:hypothetical protein
MEKRESARHGTDVPVRVTVQDKEVGCRLVNLSADGALLRVDAVHEGELTDGDLGEDAQFVLRLRSSTDRLYTGEIIRLFYRDESKFVALRFWEEYREIV